MSKPITKLQIINSSSVELENVKIKINEVIDHLNGEGKDQERREYLQATCDAQSDTIRLLFEEIDHLKAAHQLKARSTYDHECMNCGLLRSTIDDCHISVCKPTQSIHVFPKEEPHEHSYCKNPDTAEGLPYALCCLCYKHDGCELYEKPIVFATPEDLKRNEDAMWKDIEEEEKPAEPSGWEERFKNYVETYQLFTNEAYDDNLPFDRQKERVVSFIKQIEREAKLSGFDEAYVITAESNNSGEAYNRLQKKRAEL